LGPKTPQEPGASSDPSLPTGHGIAAAKPTLWLHISRVLSPAEPVECQKASPGIERLDTGLRMIMESFTSRTKTRYLPPRGAPTRGSQIFHSIERTLLLARG